MEDKNQKQDEGKAEVTKETKEEVKAEAKDKNAPAAEPIKYTAVEPRPPRKLTELKVTFGPLTEKNRELLRAINKLCLPVSYSNDFYLSLALTPGRYCRFAYYKDVPIGGISCKMEEYKGQMSMYIMTIGVLPQYRRFRIASQLLEQSIQECAKANGGKSAYLHVQTSNASAVRFYENNQFKIAETLENYYTDNIVPPHAYVMLKNFD